MPRSSGLSRSMSRWAFHVSSSVGATLIAALLVQAYPRPVAENPAPVPELTSGGKFAARVAATQAYDGLDTMPLPHVAPAPTEPAPAIVPVAFPLVPAPVDAGLVVRPSILDAAPARGHAKTAKIVRAPASAEPRRAAVEMPAASADVRGATLEPAAEDGGFLDQVVARTRQVWSTTSATTRAAWTTTTSTGSALIAHVVP